MHALTPKSFGSGLKNVIDNGGEIADPARLGSLMGAPSKLSNMCEH